ncbi:MAG: aspartate--ammonia ligase [Eubacteriales bacterium]
MMNTFIPENYHPKLSIYETQTAIGLIKRGFEDRLAAALNLKRVTAPLFLDPATGLNDNLNGVERPVSFDIANSRMTAEVVQSLAKWKRMALGKYGFKAGEGIYTDMNAIRRDEELDNIHSVYTDQWDWEKVILRTDRNIDYLKAVVRSIVTAAADTSEALKEVFPVLAVHINPTCTFITSQELEDMYPGLTVKQRENEFTREYGSVFIMQIGKKLKSGKSHDGRAPDYDDWDLNGDILIWDEVLGIALEISSMGIRVDEKSLDLQLTAANADNRRSLDFHKKLLAGELPLTIGGGIGQSRLCMLLLEKAHIGEVQVSVWDEETTESCRGTRIVLL